MPNQNDKAHLFLKYWTMLAPATAPQPEAEYPFSLLLGRRHKFDWCFVANKIAVEVDGGQWQMRGGRHATDTDREKMNLAASLHYLVFRFSPEMLNNNPGYCVELVMRAMQPTQRPAPAADAREEVRG